MLLLIDCDIKGEAMKEVGKRGDYTREQLRHTYLIKNDEGLIDGLPVIREGRCLLCLFDKWGRESNTAAMFLCESKDDVNVLLKRYQEGWALHLSFFTVANQDLLQEQPATREAVNTLIQCSRSKKEWDNNVQKAKALVGGAYPSFWFNEMIISPFYDDTQDIQIEKKKEKFKI